MTYDFYDHPSQRPPQGQGYICFLCGEPMTVLDSLNGDLVSINVNGRATTVHRKC